MGKLTPVVWLLFVAALFLAACEEDYCDLGATECMSDSILRVCVEGEDHNIWFVTQCGSNEVCMKGFLGPLSPSLGGGSASGASDAGVTAVGSASTTATDSSPRDLCVGACSAGDSECVSDALSRYCVAGGVWQLDMCSLGERCADGICMLSDDEGAVQRCVPGEQACASEMVEKVCDPDGTAWIFQGCGGNEICMGTECVPDLASSCDDGNVCLDNKTAIRCLGEDQGFEVVDCEGDTYCEGGGCRGATCTIGSTCAGTVNGMAQIRECVDGQELRDSLCPAGEVCRQTKDRAECEPAVCDPAAPYATVCGDPEDSEADETTTFTTCLVGAFSKVPELVRGECVGQTVCDPAWLGTTNPCRQDCTDGAQICGSTADGIADGYRDCDDGEWGPVKRCTEEGESTQRTCTAKADAEASDVPTILCAQPICKLAFESAGPVEGTCQDGRIRRCNGDGTLAEAEDCAEGICREVTGGVQADGHKPGACDTMAECQEGEQRCVDDGMTATPRFQSCDGGVWSPALESCEDDTSCYDYNDSEGLRRKLCDAECAPNTRRCNGDAVQICDSSGKWGADIECDAGRCVDLAGQDAACRLPCSPGTVQCVGGNLIASDLVHAGMDQQRVCGEDGQWEDPTDCTGTEACRVGRLGVATGCVECVGSDVLGGNEQGYADTRCQGSDESQGCDDDNTWEDAVACSGSTECVGRTADSCGSCTGPDGTTTLDPCTNTAWQAVAATCSSCTGPDGSTLTPCTNTAWEAVAVCGTCPTASDANDLPCTTTNIVANSGTTGRSTCTDAAAGASAGVWAGEVDCCVDTQQTYGDLGNSCTNGPWAGETDCCDTAQQSYGDLGSSCTSSAWGAETDCCVIAQTTGSGPAFAYCAEP